MVYPIADSIVRLKTLFLGRAYPVRRSESFRPFFIVGAPRSGNTLLRRILVGSPEVHIPPETYVLGATIRVYCRNRHRTWAHIVRLVLSLFEYHPDFGRFNICLRPLFDRILEAPTDTRSLALILDSFYRYHAASLEKPCDRWGDKTPLNVYWLPEIQGVFRDAQFIHIVRDGVDSVYSMLVKTQFAWSLQKAATRWNTSVTSVRAFSRRNPKICHELRYEELVRDPLATAQRICQFLDISFRASMIESVEQKELLHDITDYAHHTNVLKPIMIDSIGKGRRELTREQKVQLQRVIGGSLAHLAYDPATK